MRKKPRHLGHVWKMSKHCMSWHSVITTLGRRPSMEFIESFEATGAGESCLGTGHQADISAFLDSCYFQDTKIHLPHLFPKLRIMEVLRWIPWVPKLVCENMVWTLLGHSPIIDAGLTGSYWYAHIYWIHLILDIKACSMTKYSLKAEDWAFVFFF